jgi:hypothetical protein
LNKKNVGVEKRRIGIERIYTLQSTNLTSSPATCFAQTSAPEDFSRWAVFLESGKPDSRDHNCRAYFFLHLKVSGIVAKHLCASVKQESSQRLTSRASRGRALTKLPAAGVAYTKCTIVR